MVRSFSVVVIVVAASLLGGCSSIGNMFKSTGPDRLINEAAIPRVQDSLENLPKGIVADKDAARHTGQTLIPQ